MAILSEPLVTEIVWSNPRPGGFLYLMTNPTFWSLIGCGFGVFLFFRGFAFLKRKRFIQNVPRSTIRGASLGLVEVTGKVTGPYTIVAPLSGEDCFYYRTMAWQQSSRASWKTAAEETLATPFYLDDGTGKLMVDPRGAQTDLVPVVSEEYAGSVPDYSRRFLSRHGISAEDPVKLEESCIHAGDVLFILGTLRQNTASAETGSRDTGFLSADAADLQRREEVDPLVPLPAASYPKATSSRDASMIGFDLFPPVVLRKERAEDRLLISVRSEREIVQELAWQSALYIWGGPLLTIACFWYLLTRLTLLPN